MGFAKPIIPQITKRPPMAYPSVPKRTPEMIETQAPVVIKTPKINFEYQILMCFRTSSAVFFVYV